MKNRIPIHMYAPFNQLYEAGYNEVDSWWLEVQTEEELENLKRRKPGPSFIPVIKDPSLVELCLKNTSSGIAVPLRFKDGLLSHTHQPETIRTSVYLIEEAFANITDYDEFPARVSRIESDIMEIKNAGFRNLSIDLFHPDPVACFKANRHLKKAFDLNHVISLVPLPDLTESMVRNAPAISTLFYEKVGSVLLIKPPEAQLAEPALELGRNILANLKLQSRTHRIISCPGCGRCQWDLEIMSRKIKTELDEIVAGYGTAKKKLAEGGGIAVAVMGCNVNGPGEAGDADIGIAGGKNRTGTIFKMGKPYKTIREDEVVSEMAKGIREVIDRKIE